MERRLEWRTADRDHRDERGQRCRLSVIEDIMNDVNSNLADGSVWRLHHGEREIARLDVTGADVPWVHARLAALPGFDEFRPVFEEQEQALDAEDWLRVDACYEQIRSALTMTFPDGRAVAEFMLHIHADGTAGWRWHDEPFEADGLEDAAH